MDPYIVCPTYESPHFLYRKTVLEDAVDLLLCYSDPAAVKFFNSDNCNGTSFHFTTLAEMTAYIVDRWETDYQSKGYVRFSIVDKTTGEVLGTIEFCPKQIPGADLGKLAIVRIDLRSSHEREGWIREILSVITREMQPAFGVDHIFTKAIPEASERLQALQSSGFSPLPETPQFPFPHYYINVN